MNRLALLTNDIDSRRVQLKSEVATNSISLEENETLPRAFVVINYQRYFTYLVPKTQTVLGQFLRT